MWDRYYTTRSGQVRKAIINPSSLGFPKTLVMIGEEIKIYHESVLMGMGPPQVALGPIGRQFGYRQPRVRLVDSTDNRGAMDRF